MELVIGSQVQHGIDGEVDLSESGNCEMIHGTGQISYTEAKFIFISK